MPREISQNHPLRLLFKGLAERNLIIKVGLADVRIVQYVSDLLIRFVHADSHSMYKA